MVVNGYSFSKETSLLVCVFYFINVIFDLTLAISWTGHNENHLDLVLISFISIFLICVFYAGFLVKCLA